jgi:uncharacterized protein
MKTKFAVLPLLFLLASPLFALERIVDNASLLSHGEKSGLTYRLNSIAETYRFDLVIVTENSIGSAEPKHYADNFFDNNGYGIGNGKDGCLLLIVTGSRDYRISTAGRGKSVLNSSAYGKLESDIVKLLRNDNYYGAFASFLEDWEQFLILETKGRSYNFFERWNMVLVLIGWLIGLATGCIIVHVWKKGMNTALIQTQADSYVVPDSLSFREKTDSFLYSVVTKTRRESNSSSSGGSRGGSSGRGGHGGGGGKY